MKNDLDGFYQEALFDDFIGEYQSPEGRSGSGQFSSLTEDWYTNSDVINLVHELYGGPPDLDPMSCAQANARVNALRFYAAEEDGLTQPWYGTMLLNPPWGGASTSSPKARAVERVVGCYRAGEVKECVCVLSAGALTTSWFRPLLDFPVCIPPRRLHHYGPGGEYGAPSTGTVVVYVGPRVAEFAKIFGKLGVILIPYTSSFHAR